MHKLPNISECRKLVTFQLRRKKKTIEQLTATSPPLLSQEMTSSNAALAHSLRWHTMYQLICDTKWYI